jgi:ion channel-forming bestrophin family protein
MIQYNPKDWFYFIFRFHKADTFRQLLPMMICIGIYCAIVGYLEMVYFKLGSNHVIRNISLLHTILGFALSMLLVFRTNTAYERWWEGRKLWGSLVNSSRNLAMKTETMFRDDAETKMFFSMMIPNYAFALKNHLRDKYIADEFSEINTLSKKQLSEKTHKPNMIAQAMFAKVNELFSSGKITGEQLLFLNYELQNFTEVCGACERIKKTPIPFSYSVFLKKFIFIYVMTLPIGYVFTLQWLIIPIVILIFYALASLELIAEEIENPFGTDPNDLPTDQISETIKISVKEIFSAEK